MMLQLMIAISLSCTGSVVMILTSGRSQVVFEVLVGVRYWSKLVMFHHFFSECNNMRRKSVQCKSCEWIWQDLVGDHVQNCPYTSCWDENQCKDLENPFGADDVNVISKETGTKVPSGRGCCPLRSVYFQER